MSGGLNIPKMPADHGTLKMPNHDVEQGLFDLRKSWKDLPLSAIESEYGYVHHSRRMAAIMKSASAARCSRDACEGGGRRGSRRRRNQPKRTS